MHDFNRKIVVAVLCFATGVSSCFLFAAFYSNYLIRTELIEISNSYHRALASNDKGVLESILFDEITYDSRFGNSKMSKFDYIGGIKSGTVNVESMLIDDVDVSVNNSTASLSCSMNLLLRMENSKQIQHTAKYTYLYESVNGEWKIVAISQE